MTYEVAMDPRLCGKPMVPKLFTHKYYDDTQQDAHEFLLSKLLADAPMLSTLFEGVDEPAVSCSECNAFCYTLAPEAFLILPLALKTQDGAVITSAQQAVDNYLERCLVDANYNFHGCTTCGSTAPPYKTLSLIHISEPTRR